MSLLRRIVTAPARAARGAWDFVNPKLKAGRIPYGRTILVMYLIGALIFVGYTLAKKQIRAAVLAAALLRAGGAPERRRSRSGEGAGGGRRRRRGRPRRRRPIRGRAGARRRCASTPTCAGKIFADATASLRPINVLQVLIVNIDPGDPGERPAAEGEGPIKPENTDTFVAIDELTERARRRHPGAGPDPDLGGGRGRCKGREPELRKILAEVGDLTETAKPVAAALRERRELLDEARRQPRHGLHDARPARRPARRGDLRRQPDAAGDQRSRAGAERGDARAGADRRAGARGARRRAASSPSRSTTRSTSSCRSAGQLEPAAREDAGADPAGERLPRPRPEPGRRLGAADPPLRAGHPRARRPRRDAT